MAQVFLSYAREDRAVADRLARAITAAGRSVWWDRHIKGGAEFARDIEKQLNEAERVIVLWSRHSINSRWVKDEAGEAAETGRLIAATIDGTAAPLGFRQFHNIDLSDWALEGAQIPPELADALDVQAPARAESRNPLRPWWQKKKYLSAAVIAVLIVVAGLVFASREEGVASLFGEDDAQVTLAVMPLNVGGNKQLSHLGVGLSGALADGLSRLKALTVLSTLSARAVADQNLTVNQIGDELRASHIIEGEIRAEANRYLVTVRLIETGDGTQLWSKAYEVAGDRIADLEPQILQDSAAALQAHLGVGQGRLTERKKVDRDAYEAYLKGVENLSTRYSPSSRKEAVRQFQLAVSLDPDFADAHAGLAYILALSIPNMLGMTREELLRAQSAANSRALELAPDNPLALVALAIYLQNFTLDLAASEKHAKRALQLSPDFGPAHYALAGALRAAGLIRQSIPHYDRAVRSDPFNKVYQLYRVKAFNDLGDYEEVRRAALACRMDCEGFDFEWLGALWSHANRQQYERDYEVVRSRVQPHTTPEIFRELMIITDKMIFGKPGQILAPAPDDFGWAYAASLAIMGRIDDSFIVAHRSLDRMHVGEIVEILGDGRFVFPPSVRADPRFHALFRDPRLDRLAVRRRQEGKFGGLPLEPSAVAAEERRLAALRLPPIKGDS